MRPGFAWRVASRYFRSRRRVGSPLFSVAGIAAGIMTLTTVLAVMNGFQLSFIEPILEVRSYHLQVRGAGQAAADQLRRLHEVVAVSPFVDVQAIAGGSLPCTLRLVDPDPGDAGFAGAFAPALDRPGGRPAAAGSVILGSQLAARLGARPGDTVSFFAFAAGGQADVSPRELTLKVSGLFKTGYYDLDLNWAFAPLSTIGLIAGQAAVSPVLGVKVSRPAREAEVARQVRALLGPAVAVTGWREVNRLFFTALKTEKAMMMLLIGLVFVVVAVNIFHSLRRAVHEREEEIATLRAVGATGQTVRAVFVIEGLLIGAAGALVGNVLGLLMSYNVNEVFAAVELVLNRVILPVAEAVARPLLGGPPQGELLLFSPGCSTSTRCRCVCCPARSSSAAPSRSPARSSRRWRLRAAWPRWTRRKS